MICNSICLAVVGMIVAACWSRHRILPNVHATVIYDMYPRYNTGVVKDTAVINSVYYTYMTWHRVAIGMPRIRWICQVHPHPQ